MTAPSFGSAGTHQNGTAATINFAVPASVAAGDIIVAVLFIDGSTVTVSGLPTGFAHAEGSPVIQGSGATQHSLNVMWKRATGADTGTYDFTLSGSIYRAGAALRYTGAAATGNPWDSPTSTATDPTATTTTPAVNVTTAGPDRLLIFAGSDWSGGAWTPPTSFTERMDAGDEVHTAADLVQTAAGASGNVSATCANAGSHAAWLGALQPATAAAPPPQPLKPAGIRPRWSRTPTRRGRFTNPPWPQGALPPTWVPPMLEPAGMRPRGSRTLVRRGRFWAPPWTQGPLAPSWIAPMLDPARRAGALTRIRRGRFWAPPLVGGLLGAPPQWLRQPRLKLDATRTRRGKFIEPPWGQGPLAASWIPPMLEPARRPGALNRVRRGRFLAPPFVVALPGWIPAPLVAVRRAAARPVRRGEFWTPPWTQGAQPSWLPPPLCATHRSPPRPVRRGRFNAPPWTITAPPGVPGPLSATRRAPVRPPRRGRFLHPPWTQGPLAPFLAPDKAAATRRQTRPVRRGRFWAPPWPQGDIIPLVPNPVVMTIEGSTTATTMEGTSSGGSAEGSTTLTGSIG